MEVTQVVIQLLLEYSVPYVQMPSYTGVQRNEILAKRLKAYPAGSAAINIL